MMILAMKKKRIFAVIGLFVCVFMIANVIVQSIYLQEVEAMVWVEPFIQTLEQYAPELITLMIAVGGIVFEDELDPLEMAKTFGAHCVEYYNQYMAEDIKNVLESFNGKAAEYPYTMTYNEVGQVTRNAILDFVDDVWTTITGEGLYTVTGTAVLKGAFTGEGATINDPVEYVISLDGGANFRVPYINMGDIRLDRYFSPLSYDPPKWKISWDYYPDEPAMQVVRYGGFGPVTHYYDWEQGSSITFKADGLYMNGELIESNLAGAYGQDDVILRFYNELAEPLIMEDVPPVYAIDDGMVLDPGIDWREEHEEDMRKSICPPWTIPGQTGVLHPDVVGGMEGLTGEGVGVDDVTVPLTTDTDYPNDYTGDMTGVGDVPLDIPGELEGNPGSELVFDWSSIRDITTVFPFSIPWDIQRVLALFDHYEDEPPEFEIPIDTILVDLDSEEVYTIKIDWLEPYIEFIRWMLWILCVMAFIVFMLRHFVSGG